jgi:hypothetical protein
VSAFKVGDRIEATQNGFLYEGVVTAVNTDGTIDVLWNDGTVKSPEKGADPKGARKIK